MFTDERLIDVMSISDVKRYWELKQRRGYLSYSELIEFKRYKKALI